MNYPTMNALKALVEAALRDWLVIPGQSVSKERNK